MAAEKRCIEVMVHWWNFIEKMDSLKQGKHMDAVMVHGILPI